MPPSPTKPIAPTASAPTPVLRSQELFGEGNTVQIEHAGERYLLRRTRTNKLILTK